MTSGTLNPPLGLGGDKPAWLGLRSRRFTVLDVEDSLSRGHRLRPRKETVAYSTGTIVVSKVITVSVGRTRVRT